jgi:2-oxoglutarate dehydrogenase E1 component
MPEQPIASVFNDAYAAEQFEAYRRDPASVEESWRQFFRFAEQAMGGYAPAAASSAAAGPVHDEEYARKVAGAARYTTAIRTYGHFAVQLDPLGTPPPGAPELTLEFFGIVEADLDIVTGASLGFPHLATARDVANRLKKRYCTNLAVEVQHLGSEEERAWFRQLFTEEKLTAPLSADEKKAVLRRLTEVDGFERFLGKAFVGYKRFSIEGTDALVPMLDTAIERSAAAGVKHVALAMAHRGRISVLTHVLGKPALQIFSEFQGKHGHLGGMSSTGDVKYHMGYVGSRAVDGRDVEALVWCRTRRTSKWSIRLLEGAGSCSAARRAGPTLCAARMNRRWCQMAIHGDAAFPGEGIVAETLNISHLNAYRTGGTIHIIVNNQVGFTTDPTDARSTHYASRSSRRDSKCRSFT